MKARLGRFGRVVTLVPTKKGGGEGDLFSIAGELTIVAKIFNAQVLADLGLRKEKKIEVMKGLRPRLTRGLRKSIAITWPLETVVNLSHEFLGYTMPLVKGKPIFEVYHAPIRPPSVGAIQILTIARELSLGLKELHADGIVVGDINPENILIGPDGAPIWIDADSMQITLGTDAFFCQVGRPEFLAPDLLNAPLASTVRTPAHDLYSLSVLFFHLFNDGDHPFRAHWKGSGVKPTLTERIRAGHWPHDPHNKGRVAPPAGSHFERLPVEFRTLFRQAFVDGVKDRSLWPSCDDWSRALDSVVRSGSFQTLWQERRRSGRAANASVLNNVHPRMLAINHISKGASTIWKTLFAIHGNRVLASVTLPVIILLIVWYLAAPAQIRSGHAAFPTSPTTATKVTLPSTSIPPSLPPMGTIEKNSGDGLSTPKIWSRLARTKN